MVKVDIFNVLYWYCVNFVAIPIFPHGSCTGFELDCFALALQTVSNTFFLEILVSVDHVHRPRTTSHYRCNFRSLPRSPPSLLLSLSRSPSLSVTPFNSLYPPTLQRSGPLPLSLSILSLFLSLYQPTHSFYPTHFMSLSLILSLSLFLFLLLSLIVISPPCSLMFAYICEQHTRYAPYRPEMPMSLPPRPAVSIFENSALRTLH